MFNEFTNEEDIDQIQLANKIKHFNEKLNSSIDEIIKLIKKNNQVKVFEDKYSEIKTNLTPQSIYDNIVSIIV